MPLNMHCRFAPDEHGTFANAVLLQQHYLAEHGDVYAAPAPRQCPECGRMFGATGLASHLRNMHGVGGPARTGRPSNESTGRAKVSTGPFRCDLCGKQYGSRDTMRHHIRDEHSRLDGHWRDHSTPIDEPPRAAQAVERLNGHDFATKLPKSPPNHVGPWTVDDIVLPVMEQLAQPRGLVPVGHMAAIFAWRDATAVMLSAVTR